MILKLVEFKPATPADLKADDRNLKIGQPYAISMDNGQTVNGIYCIKGDEDPFILKYYLDHGQLLVPINHAGFESWMKENEPGATV